MPNFGPRYSGVDLGMNEKNEVEDAIEWARKHAPDDVARLSHELRAARLDTGETASGKVNAQQSQRFGGEHGQPVLHLDALGSNPETARLPGQHDRPGTRRSLIEDYVTRDIEKVDDALSDDDPRLVSRAEEQREIVRRTVAACTYFEQDVYYHVFGMGLSVRQTAAELRAPSHMRVQRALDTVKAAVVAALAEESEDDPT